MDSTYAGLPFEDIDPEPAAFFANLASNVLLQNWMRQPTRVILTDENVRAAVAGSQESWVRDLECIGLRLRIRPTGGKSYYLQRSEIEDAGSGREFLGDASDFTVAQMRTKVTWLATGLYPSKPTRIKYRRDMKITKVFEKYFQEHPPAQSAWFRTAKPLFDRYVAQRYGGYFLSGMHKERWLTLIETATLDQRSRGINLHKALRSFLNWAVKRGLLQANPLARTKVELPEFEAPPNPKTLSVKQLCDVYRAARVLGEPWSIMIGLLILTGEAMEHVRHLENRNIDWNQNLWAPERQIAPEWTVRLSPEAVELLMLYRNQQGYFFRSPRSALPINFYTEIIEQLNVKTWVPWKWGIRDIRFAVRREIDRFGGDNDAVLQWSKHFVSMCDPKEDDEVTL
jgi:integrase